MGDLQRYRTLARHVEWQTLVCTLSHNGNHAFPLSGRRGFCPSVYFSQNIRLERYLSEDVEYADHGQQDDPHCERQRGHQGLDEQLAANLLGSLGEYDAAGAGQGRCRSGPNGGCEAQEHRPDRDAGGGSDAGNHGIEGGHAHAHAVADEAQDAAQRGHDNRQTVAGYVAADPLGHHLHHTVVGGYADQRAHAADDQDHIPGDHFLDDKAAIAQLEEGADHAADQGQELDLKHIAGQVAQNGVGEQNIDEGGEDDQRHAANDKPQRELLVLFHGGRACR